MIRVDSEEEVIRPDLDPKLVSRLLFGIINSLVELYDPEGSYSAENLAETVIALLFRTPRLPETPKSLNQSEVALADLA